METAEKSYPVLEVEEDNNKHEGLVEVSQSRLTAILSLGRLGCHKRNHLTMNRTT